MPNARTDADTTTTKRVSEPAYCPGCGAVYVNRHWSRLPASVLAARRSGKPIQVRVCPECRPARSGAPHGFLHVDGDFFAQHRGELEQLLRSEAARAVTQQPRHQVLAWEELQGGGLVVTTSTPHLAQQLGRALKAAYDGELHLGLPHEHKPAFIWWHR